MTTPSTAKQPTDETVRQVVATFFDAESLEQAVDALKAAGFGSEEISAVAGAQAVKQSLAGHYMEPGESKDEPGAPKTAFVGRESVGDAVHGILGAFFFTGATLAAGGLVATAGALASPVIAAIAGAAAVGGIGAVTAAQIDKSEAERLQEEIDRGHLLLFVRIGDSQQEREVLGILKGHEGFEPHVIEVS
ncbi:MAG: hypothetical protein R3229_08735 [Alphaproteobacteria bacterium]|nr:hypothetical protein [Alphaproteobacteria bacterium]